MTLYIVGTPIGNLKDITLRALEILKTVPILLVESPNDSRPLLRAYGIQPKRMIKYNDANRRRATPEILKILEAKDAALITSAGMPGVSDPAAELVRECRARGIPVVPVPGPSALSTAIAASGFRGPFLFIEFFPRKQGEMKILLAKTERDGYKLVFFESPYRMIKTLAVIAECAPAVSVCIGREMTKKFETYLFGKASELQERLQSDRNSLKGEFTVIVGFGR